MAIDRVSHGTVAVPERARVLGRRVKPIIRLGMGHKHPEKGYPVKDDHFTIRGDERVIAKFREAYGEQPKAVKIMVPSALELALDISYKSFVGGGDGEDGGRPLALGNTNFATLGYVGGPDVLRVWRQDGSYLEVETEGLDELGKPLDEIAADLKIEVQTTFTFTIPDVLGWGSFCQIHSKGKKTADNLAFKLTEIYSAFGARAPWAFDQAEPPLLVIKPDTALMRFEDKDTKQARWGKSKIYVLDIVIPESFDAMRDRLLERQRELEGGNAAAVLYGELPEARGTSGPPAEPDGSEQGAASEQADGPVTVPPAAGPAPADDEAEDGVWTVAPTEEEVEHAGTIVVPAGVHKDKTLAQVAEDAGAGSWFLTQLKKMPANAPQRASIETFVQGRLPDTWEKFEAWKAEQS